MFPHNTRGVITLTVLALVWSQCFTCLAHSEVAIKPGEEVKDNTPNAAERVRARRAAAPSNVPDFVPTDEWQEVQPGQAIPEGLHVRMDFQTGKKEAKLLSQDERENDDSAGTSDNVDNDVDARHPEPHALQQEGRLLDVGDGIKERQRTNLHPHMTDEEMQELMARTWAKKYEALFLTSETERMKQLIAILVNATSHTDDNVLSALGELEEIVHDIDHGKDMCTLGGMIPLVHFLRSKNYSFVRASAAVIASSLGNNPGAQVAFLEAGVMPVLLDALKTAGKDLAPGDSQNDNHAAAMSAVVHALSNLVRGNSRAQEVFVNLKGAEALARVMVQTLDTTYDSVRRRILTLAYDILAAEPLAPLSVQDKQNLDTSHDGGGPHVNKEPVVEPDRDLAARRLLMIQDSFRTGEWCDVIAENIHQLSHHLRSSSLVEASLTCLDQAYSHCRANFDDKQVASSLQELFRSLRQSDHEWEQELAERAQKIYETKAV